MTRTRPGAVLGAAASIVLLVVLSPLIAGAAIARRVKAGALRGAFERRWRSRGKLGILVYSDSPNWKQHVENDLLPRVGEKVVVLNWTQRASWRRSLEVRAFEHWGGERDFNPIAILFPPRKPVLTLRYRSAFRDLKHGDIGPLRALEEALFRELGAA
jgi:hypothetical protein